MVTLYIWKPGEPNNNEWFHLKTGHVSMLVNGVYYSFYPKDKNNGKSNIGLVRSEVAQILGRTVKNDFDGAGYPHDVEFNIMNLDENAMANYWRKLIDRGQRYHICDFNCCVAAAQALNVGFNNSKKKASISKCILNDEFSIFLEWTSPNREKWPSVFERIKKKMIYAAVPTMTPRVLALFASYIDNHLNGNRIEYESIKMAMQGEKIIVLGKKESFNESD